MRQRRYGLIKVSSAVVLGNEITQERPHRRHLLLSRSGAGVAEEERTHLWGIPSMGIITERLEQLARTATILLDSRLCGPSVDLKPVTKA
jgi:hypothetical protein